MSTDATTFVAEAPRRWQPLSLRQRRVFGVLVEKAKTTPDVYPMTINGLVAGCNQKSNREPQMNLSPEEVEQVLEELGVGDRPRLLVFNKIDLLGEEDLLALQERIGRLAKGAVFVSAVHEGGSEPLRRALGAAIRSRRPLTEIRLSAGDGKLLAEIHRGGEVVDQRTDGDMLVIRARVDDALAGRLRHAGAQVIAGIKTPV